MLEVGQDSVFGIATCYSLESPGIETGWGRGRDVPHAFRRAFGPTQPLYNGYRAFFPRGKAAGAWC